MTEPEFQVRLEALLTDAQLATGLKQRIENELRVGRYYAAPGCWLVTESENFKVLHQGRVVNRVVFQVQPLDGVARDKAAQLKKEKNPP